VRRAISVLIASFLLVACYSPKEAVNYMSEERKLTLPEKYCSIRKGMSRGKVHHIMGAPTRYTREGNIDFSSYKNEDLYYGGLDFELLIWYDDDDKVWRTWHTERRPNTIPCEVLHPLGP
jgi:hypothetical protein